MAYFCIIFDLTTKEYWKADRLVFFPFPCGGAEKNPGEGFKPKMLRIFIRLYGSCYGNGIQPDKLTYPAST